MYQRKRKIPTIVGILLLLIGIGGGIFLVEQRTSGPTKASVSIEPKSVQITNITDGSFSIVWLSEEPSTGSITYGTSASNTDVIAFDDRDIDNEAKPYTTHHVTIRSLSPQTTYYFTILSSNKKFINGNNPYSITTPEKPESTNLLEPAYGQVTTPQNEPAEGSIVIINLPRSLPLSTLVKSSGNWLIPLNIARDVNFNVYKDSSGEKIPLSISVFSSVTDKATAITDTKNDSPVPTITIGKTYDFKDFEGKKKTDETKEMASIQKSDAEDVLGNQSQNSVDVIVPADNATFVSTRPLFRGIGIPGEDVLLEIKGAQSITGKTIIAKDGRWSWTPPKDLGADKHTLTVTTTDENGDEIVFNRNFLVFKSGTQVLGDATPSGSTPTPTPLSGIGTPGTPSATLAPLFTPTPTATPASIPVAGSYEITLFIIGTGSILSLIGFAKLVRSL